MHPYSPGYSGMVCDAMVLDGEGYGDSCGQQATDPIHPPLTWEGDNA